MSLTMLDFSRFPVTHDNTCRSFMNNYQFILSLKSNLKKETIDAITNRKH